MKSFILGALLPLISTASLADTAPGGVASPATPGTTSGSKAQGAKAPGSSCSKAASFTCKGCSITCAEGERAVCSDPLYNWNADKCTRDATCRCRPRRS